jgi:hypothetical protein
MEGFDVVGLVVLKRRNASNVMFSFVALGIKGSRKSGFWLVAWGQLYEVD